MAPFHPPFPVGMRHQSTIYQTEPVRTQKYLSTPIWAHRAGVEHFCCVSAEWERVLVPRLWNDRGQSAAREHRGAPFDPRIYFDIALLLLDDLASDPNSYPLAGHSLFRNGDGFCAA